MPQQGLRSLTGRRTGRDHADPIDPRCKLRGRGEATSHLRCGGRRAGHHFTKPLSQIRRSRRRQIEVANPAAIDPDPPLVASPEDPELKLLGGARGEPGSGADLGVRALEETALGEAAFAVSPSMHEEMRLLIRKDCRRDNPPHLEHVARPGIDGNRQLRERVHVLTNARALNLETSGRSFEAPDRGPARPETAGFRRYLHLPREATIGQTLPLGADAAERADPEKPGGRPLATCFPWLPAWNRGTGSDRCWSTGC